MNEQSENPQGAEPAKPVELATVQAASEPAPSEPVSPEPTSSEVTPPVQAASDAAAPVPESGRKRARRGRIAAVAGAVLLVGAVIAGGACTVVTVRDADRDAGAPSWKFPKSASGAVEEAKPASSLAGMLVPYDAGLNRGPDIAEFGSEAVLSGGKAEALRKEAVRDLPRSRRREIEKRIDDQHTMGMAMRSYLVLGTARKGEGPYDVEIELAQIQDKRAVRNMSTFQNEFFDALQIFRAGPKVEGHKNAKCFLSPKDKKRNLDTMICSAYQGDVLVGLTASGTGSMDTEGVARLLRIQLDRIQEPGEAV
ncbi:hypothetical protein ACWEBX_09880 [Streptomyces sp. NPDC005070]